MSLSGSNWEWPPPVSTGSCRDVCDGTSVFICPGPLGTLAVPSQEPWGGVGWGTLWVSLSPAPTSVIGRRGS